MLGSQGLNTYRSSDIEGFWPYGTEYVSECYHIRRNARTQLVGCDDSLLRNLFWRENIVWIVVRLPSVTFSLYLGRYSGLLFIIPICSQVHVENVLNHGIAYSQKRAAGAKKFRALRLNSQINVFTKLAEIIFNCALCICPRFFILLI